MFRTFFLGCVLIGACSAASGASAAGFASQMPDFDSIWNGYYLGMGVGYVRGNATDGASGFPDTDITGELIGVQSGINFYLSQGVVLGIQGDINWSNVNGSTGKIVDPNNNSYFTKTTDTIEWSGAATARLGFAAGRLMPYALGGVAFAGNKVKQSGVDSGGTFEAEQKATQVGWTVGVGVDAAFTRNLSGFVEYRYTDYGSETYSDLVTGDPISLTDNKVRVGVNYHMR